MLCFRALTARARAADGTGAAVALFTEALQLWRGPALADFADVPFAAPVAVRLTEERLTVVEERAEYLLQLGGHGPLADELRGTVREHPLRERLLAAYLRALYGAGRQAEALAAYEELRRRLAEELGADPGPEIAGLHRDILRHSPGSRRPGSRPGERRRCARARTCPRRSTRRWAGTARSRRCGNCCAGHGWCV